MWLQTERGWLRADGEDVGQTVPMPEFRSEAAMREYLPPQLWAALSLTKARACGVLPVRLMQSRQT